MDMVISAGKSRKNVEAYVLLPPDARKAIDLLIKTRKLVGVPDSNEFVFARLSADTAMSGNVELQDVVLSCPGLKYPDRISSRHLRRYIATVSQVCCFISTFQYMISRLSINILHCCLKPVLVNSWVRPSVHMDFGSDLF